MNTVEAAMRGMVFTGEREIEQMDFPAPTPGPGEDLDAMVGLVDRALALI